MKILLLVFTTSTFVWAQNLGSEGPSANSRPYYFSGPCTSQGSWTQEALMQTQRLREITTQLRDDPSCKALGESLQRSFGQIQESLEGTEQSMSGNQNAVRNQLQENKALRETAIESPGLSPIAGANILKNLYGIARIKTLSNDLTNANPMSLTSAAASQLLSAGGDRISRVAGRGFTLFNQTIDSLPRLNECLTKKNVMGQALASSVSMLGALVSSGQDPLGNQAAMAISKIANFMRDDAFSEILGLLNQQEFMSSIQCIMETTAESYCSARDSRLLFDEMTKELGARKQKQADDKIHPIPSNRTFDNPLNGFYVLTQFSPIVTDWVFRIQIGSSPKLREDGQYQMSVLNNANNFYIKMKEIESEFNQLKRNISTYTDFTSKQNYAKDLVLKLGDVLLKAGGPTGENFFQNAGSSYEIFFNLLGMDPPAEVKEKGNVMDPTTWLNIHYRELPIFSTPDNVPNVVWKKLAVVFEAGKANMLNYYFKNFVADQIGVIDESLIGLPYDIKSALYNIDNYLAGLETKIKQKSKDHTILGSIYDTRLRIGKIFYRYNDLLTFINSNKDFLSKKPTPEEERNFKQTLLEKNVALMDEVYSKLEVMLAKSGFLANRLVTYVTYDYQMFVKHSLTERNSESDLLYKEIAYASGRLAYDQLVQMSSGGQTKVKFDLENASRIFKENMAAQEMLFVDSVVGILQKLKLSATRSYVDSRAVSIDSIKRAYNDGWKPNPLDDRGPVQRFLAGAWRTLLTVIKMEDQRYPVHYLPLIGIRDNLAYSTDDEHHSAEQVFNRMCIQSLVFNDYKNPRWRALYNLCKDAKVASPFKIEQVAGLENGLKDDYLSVDFQKKFKEDLPDYRANHSKRICAFRDFNRRNLVVYLTMNFKSPEFLHNNNSDNPYLDVKSVKEDDIKPDPMISSIDPTKPVPNLPPESKAAPETLPASIVPSFKAQSSAAAGVPKGALVQPSVNSAPPPAPPTQKSAEPSLDDPEERELLRRAWRVLDSW